MELDSDWIRIQRIGWIRIQFEAGFGFKEVDSNPPDTSNPDSNKGCGFESTGLDSDGPGRSKVAVGQLGWQLLVEVGIGSWQLAVGMLKLMLMFAYYN